jgi:hypothetical protein
MGGTRFRRKTSERETYCTECSRGLRIASRMKASRAALVRLLAPDNPSVTIGTLESAAAALNRRLTVELR